MQGTGFDLTELSPQRAHAAPPCHHARTSVGQDGCLATWFQHIMPWCIYDDTRLSALTTRQRAKRNFNTKTRIRNLRRTHSDKGYTIPQCALLDCSETWTAPNSLEASHLRDRAQRSLKHFHIFRCLLHMLHDMDRTIPKNLQETKDPLHKPLTRRKHSVACTLLVCGVCLQSKTRTFAI